jgi:hypothetical protein
MEDMEAAREIFNQCCAEIAASLADADFQYRTSKHSAIRMSGDLTFEIHFQSSFRNYLVPNEGGDGLKRVISKLIPLGDLATFGSVTLIEHATVYSKMIKKFRESLPSIWTVNDAVTGGQIGNLRSPAKWIQFNLANPHTRTKVVAEAAKLIDTVALPYFELFKNPAEVIARLLDSSMPWTWEPSALEYVCCFGSKDQALQLLDRLINDSPARRAEYHGQLLRYRSDGLSEVWDSKAASRLAKAAIILGLDGQ